MSCWFQAQIIFWKWPGQHKKTHSKSGQNNDPKNNLVSIVLIFGRHGKKGSLTLQIQKRLRVLIWDRSDQPSGYKGKKMFVEKKTCVLQQASQKAFQVL